MTINDKISEALISYDGHIGDYIEILAALDSLLGRNAELTANYILEGPESCHGGALMYIRQDCGYEAYGFNSEDGNSMYYKYRISSDSNWIILKPKYGRDLKAEMKLYGL